MEFFLNPWSMVAGGAMISAPILIHLINRMRFKRIRWAAMEFLLKSQKRNRRRLIIEQIILLMLRCLMMVLAGLLLARYIGYQPPPETDESGVRIVPGTLHVALLDDTLSTTDRTPQAQGGEPDAFSVARKRIKDLALLAAQSEIDQYLRVVLMSTQDVLFEGDPKEGDALNQLETKLNTLTPKLIHASPREGLKKCKALLEQPPLSKEERQAAAEEANKTDSQGEKKDDKDKKEAKLAVKRVWYKRLYVYSDFRDSDWGRRVGSEGLYRLVDDVRDAGGNVWLVDAADPPRQPGAESLVVYHNNYAITDLRPEKRIAPGNSVVSFTVEIANLGGDTRERLLMKVFKDGEEDFTVNPDVTAPPPGGRVRQTFEMLFEAPEEGQQSKQHRITVWLQNVDVESGLLADNFRHTTLEIRRDVPTLVIDGSGEVGLQPGGDTRVIKDALESAKDSETTKVVAAGLTELLRDDLEREYAAIYLVNIENLKHPKPENKGEEDLPLERLKKFVDNGGNVVFFTGGRIDVDYYNKVLFKEKKGLFPVPLEKQVTEKLSDEEIEKRRNSSAPKIYVLDPEHPVTVGIAPLQLSIPDLIISQYTPAKDRSDWPKAARKEEEVKELITLANLKKVNDATRGQTQGLLKKLPIDDAAYKKYEPLLSKHKSLIEQTLLEAKADEMYKVANALEAMLNDKGPKPKEKDNVSLVEFWSRPEQEVQDLRENIVNFRRDALYGSPLALTRKYGKGNVVAVLTTSGTAWSGWSGGKQGGAASFTFPMFMVDLQKFLTAGGAGVSQLVGEKYEITVDEKLYEPRMRRLVQGEDAENKKGVPPQPGIPAGFADVGELTSQRAPGGKLVFSFAAVAGPGKQGVERGGINIFRLKPKGKNELEDRWVAFNVDTENESNLKRAASNDVSRPVERPFEGRGTIGWYNVEDPPQDQGMPSSKDKKNAKEDLSHGPWLFLVFLLILIVEQALAVHLSFHAKRSEPAA